METRVLLATTLPPGFEVTNIVHIHDDLDWLPMSQAFSPDGRLFITEKNTGRIRIVKNDVLLPEPFLELPVDTFGERGMNRIAFDPDFEDNGYVYVYYTRPDPDNPDVTDNNARNRVSRFTVSPTNPDRALRNSELILIDDIPSTGNHNGGALEFGADGKLYLATGDSFVSGRAQQLNNLAGKVLRINPDGSIPSDNPFVGVTGARPEIWALGLRNPWTGAMMPGTSLFYINDVGERSYEEINVIRKGKNYGWPNAEGPSSNPAYTNPVHYYDTGALGAITGGTFYTGDQFPERYHGQYFFADYEHNFIRVLDPATLEVRSFAHWSSDEVFPADLDVGPDGSIYVLSLFLGEVYKISYTGADNRAPTADARVDSYIGQAPFVASFDGSASSDPDGDSLSYFWNFGDGNFGSGAKVTHTYGSPGRYLASLTVSDGRGGSDVEYFDMFAVGEASQRKVRIRTSDTIYVAGDTIKFSGTARAADGSTIPAEAFAWKIDFHHRDHFHPFLSNITGVKSGKFKIPTTGETDHKVFYRITLTVADEFGAFSTTADVDPVLSKLRLRSNVRGLTLHVNDVPIKTQKNVRGVAGLEYRLSAPKRQRLNGLVYEFVSWSDGGRASHDVTVSAGTSTFRARYRVDTSVRLRQKPKDDTYVRSGSGNNGREPLLLAEQRRRTLTYLRFNLEDLSPSQIKRARLRLFGAVRGLAGDGIRVAVHGADPGTWRETELTWSNKPLQRGRPLDVVTLRDDVERYYVWDVTRQVRRMLRDGHQDMTLVVRNLDGGNVAVGFNSTEAGARKPLLILDVEPDSDGGFLASGVLGSSFSALVAPKGGISLYDALEQTLSADDDLVLIRTADDESLPFAP